MGGRRQYQRKRPPPTRRLTRGCPSGKVRFRDQTEAVRAMHSTQNAAKTNTRRRPASRVYPCGKCGGWHLTSSPEHGHIDGIDP